MRPDKRIEVIPGKEILLSVKGKREQYFKDLITKNRNEFTDDENMGTGINTISSPFRVSRREVEERCGCLKNGNSLEQFAIPA